MNKSSYIFVAGFLSLGYLNSFLSADIQFVLFMIWTIWGYYYYPGYSELYTNKNRGIIFLLFLLFFLSTLTPVFRYNQSLIGTAIAMRGNLVILFLLTLFKIRPDEEDFYTSFKTLAIIALILSIIVFLFPHFFASEEKIRNLSIRQSQGSTDFLVSWPGSVAVVFYFYMTLGRMLERSQKNDFLWCTICMIYIFVMQNRSTLIGTVPFYIYGLLKVDVKYKKIVIALIIISVGSFIYNIISSLIVESTNQLNDKNYNRWQAVSFFLFEQRNNIYTILFGHGVPCANSDYLKYLQDAQNNRYAIASDIGMFGSFYFYGITTVCLVYYYVIIGIIKKNIPLFVKFNCIWIVGVPTIHSFGHGMAITGTIKLLLIVYLIIYCDNKYNKV